MEYKFATMQLIRPDEYKVVGSAYRVPGSERPKNATFVPFICVNERQNARLSMLNLHAQYLSVSRDVQALYVRDA